VTKTPGAFVILTSFVSLGRRRSQTVGHSFISRRKLQQRFGNILIAHQRRHALVVRSCRRNSCSFMTRRTIRTASGGGEMPESWNAGEYRNRATAWLQKAESMPAGRERDACLVLADGYTKLAELLEAQQGTPIRQ
jgi:hypothetical protein